MVASTLRVLVVHYNTPAMTTRLVRSLPSESPSGRPVNVHLIDNDSTPDNLGLLRDGVAGIGHVVMVESAVNLGFGEGLNRLIASAAISDEDVLWLLNPDTEVLGSCLEALETELDRGEHAIVSPVIVSGEPASPWIWYAGGTLDVRKVRVQHELYGAQVSAVPESDPPFTTEFVTGAAMMMRAGTLRSLGGFPTDYFLYWEDALLSWKVRQSGRTMAVVPAARLWHAVGASSGTGQTRTFYYWAARNRARFTRDTGGRAGSLLLGAGAAETARALARTLKERRGRGGKLVSALRGTARGLHDFRKA